MKFVVANSDNITPLKVAPDIVQVLYDCSNTVIVCSIYRKSNVDLLNSAQVHDCVFVPAGFWQEYVARSKPAFMIFRKGQKLLVI